MADRGVTTWPDWWMADGRTATWLPSERGREHESEGVGERTGGERGGVGGQNAREGVAARIRTPAPGIAGAHPPYPPPSVSSHSSPMRAVFTAPRITPPASESRPATRVASETRRSAAAAAIRARATRCSDPASRLGSLRPEQLIKLGFPQPIYEINQGGDDRTSRAPPGVPDPRASLEPGTSGFLTLRINHYATRRGS